MVRKFLRLVKEKLKDLSGNSSKVKDKKIKNPIETKIIAENKIKYFNREINSKHGERRSITEFPPKKRSNKPVIDSEKKIIHSSAGNEPRIKDSFNKSKAGDKIKGEEWQKDNWDISSFEVPVQEGKMRFHDLNLPVEIMHAIYDFKISILHPRAKRNFSSYS